MKSPFASHTVRIKKFCKEWDTIKGNSLKEEEGACPFGLIRSVLQSCSPFNHIPCHLCSPEQQCVHFETLQLYSPAQNHEIKRFLSLLNNHFLFTSRRRPGRADPATHFQGRELSVGMSAALEEISQGGCAASSPGGLQDQPRQCPEEPELD